MYLIGTQFRDFGETVFRDFTRPIYNRAYTVFINGGRAERPGFEYMKTRLGRPWLQITDHNKNGVL